MTKIYNWGILAPGNIAGKFVSELKGIDCVRVLAVGSRDFNRAKEFATTFDIARYYGSYEELVADPDIDVVYIASPHAFHAEHTKLCLHHKKAVLCEKAFALNTSEVKGMIEAANLEQVFLMEAMMTPHQPSYQEARKIIESGVLGEIKHLHGWFGFNKSPYDLNGRLYNPLLGGGALLDIGLYPLFDVLWFMGQPLDIFAFADRTLSNIDQSVTVSMQFEGGKSASVFASFLSAVGVGTDILCENGALHLRRSSALNQSLEILLPGEPVKTLCWQGNSCGLKMEALEVIRCLDRNQLESSVMSHQSSLQLINLIDSIKVEAGVLLNI